MFMGPNVTDGQDGAALLAGVRSELPLALGYSYNTGPISIFSDDEGVCSPLP